MQPFPCKQASTSPSSRILAHENPRNEWIGLIEQSAQKRGESKREYLFIYFYLLPFMIERRNNRAQKRKSFDWTPVLLGFWTQTRTSKGLININQESTFFCKGDSGKVLLRVLGREP